MAIASTDAHALMQLASDLAKDLKIIIDINDEMDTNLKNLGVTMLDDGYQDITGYVAMAKVKLKEALPQLEHVAKSLLAQAEQVLAMRRATGQ